MGQWNTYSTRWEENIATILHIYLARAIFYYFVINKTPNMINEILKS